MKIGYVKIHRKLVEWGWYQDCVVKSVFLHLILNASFKESQWMGINIKKGQVIIGTEQLAKDLVLSRQQVRTAINKLKSTNEITTKATNQFTVVTLVKWEEFQSNDEIATNKLTDKATNEQPTDNQRITNEQPHIKNIKNNKNINNNICAPAKKNKFYNFEQKPIDYETVRQKNLEKLLKKWSQE